MIEILNLNYNLYVDVIGTAHFTRRSVNEAFSAVKSSIPLDLALELDWRRYRRLDTACTACPRRAKCRGFCEFTVAADAIGNSDANIWLIDMTEQEMQQRFTRTMTPHERSRKEVFAHYPSADLVQLWERGYKKTVVDYSERRIEVLRQISPSIPRVLIDERNALMAARLAWIASTNLAKEEKSKILAFVGAAHKKGIDTLLRNPLLIRERLHQLQLPFSEPTLIRRISVQDSAS